MTTRPDTLRPPRALHSLIGGVALSLMLGVAVFSGRVAPDVSTPSRAQPERSLAMHAGGSLHAGFAKPAAPAAIVAPVVPVVQIEPVEPELVRELRTDPEASEPDPASTLPEEPGVDGLGEELTPATPETDPELDEVFWEVPEDMSLDLVASSWGMKLSTLRELNPEVVPEAKRSRGASGEQRVTQPEIAAGTKLCVFRKDTETLTRSIGAPNRGRLRDGIPMPEGPFWRLRKRRPRSFGTHKTISSMLAALRVYGERYPDGPRVGIGEFSKLRGGRIYPHRSHRTGRDVDVGYVKLGDDPKRTGFRATTQKNFDAERNWVLIYALLQTGNVQSIYMSSRLQKLLYKEAKKHVPEEELRRYFQYPWHEDSATAVIHHQHGHKNHFHVRFRCEDWNHRCRARSRQQLAKKSSPNA